MVTESDHRVSQVGKDLRVIQPILLLKAAQSHFPKWFANIFHVQLVVCIAL